jgi:hypothetical protein
VEISIATQAVTSALYQCELARAQSLTSVCTLYTDLISSADVSITHPCACPNAVGLQAEPDTN